jgi:hypothetical protein
MVFPIYNIHINKGRKAREANKEGHAWLTKPLDVAMELHPKLQPLTQVKLSVPFGWEGGNPDCREPK